MDPNLQGSMNKIYANPTPVRFSSDNFFSNLRHFVQLYDTKLFSTAHVQENIEFKISWTIKSSWFYIVDLLFIGKLCLSRILLKLCVHCLNDRLSWTTILQLEILTHQQFSSKGGFACCLNVLSISRDRKFANFFNATFSANYNASKCFAERLLFLSIRKQVKAKTSNCQHNFSINIRFTICYPVFFRFIFLGLLSLTFFQQLILLNIDICCFINK